MEVNNMDYLRAAMYRTARQAAEDIGYDSTSTVRRNCARQLDAALNDVARLLHEEADDETFHQLMGEFDDTQMGVRLSGWDTTAPRAFKRLEEEFK